MRSINSVLEKMDDFFFHFFISHFPALSPTANLAEPPGTAICLTVPSSSNCYVQLTFSFQMHPTHGAKRSPQHQARRRVPWRLQ